MSASTQGTPDWLLRLEQAQMQLKPENYATWLLTKAKEHGIPDEVINAQLLRLGYEPLQFEDVPEEVLQAEFKEHAALDSVYTAEPKRKAGRPRKQ